MEKSNKSFTLYSRCVSGGRRMMKKNEIFYGAELDRLFYIWLRYAGRRDKSKHGKHYTKSDVEDLIRKLTKFKNDKDSFKDGFEKEDDNCTEDDEVDNG